MGEDYGSNDEISSADVAVDHFSLSPLFAGRGLG
jgi:hypothetical protein